jgi:colicin import membrane protein
MRILEVVKTNQNQRRYFVMPLTQQQQALQQAQLAQAQAQNAAQQAQTSQAQAQQATRQAQLAQAQAQQAAQQAQIAQQQAQTAQLGQLTQLQAPLAPQLLQVPLATQQLPLQ